MLTTVHITLQTPDHKYLWPQGLRQFCIGGRGVWIFGFFDPKDLLVNKPINNA